MEKPVDDLNGRNLHKVKHRKPCVNKLQNGRLFRLTLPYNPKIFQAIN